MDDDCPEYAAFISEMKAAVTEQFGPRPSMSPQQVQQALERYLSLSDDDAARLRETLAMTKAGQKQAHFIAASHRHRLR